MKMLRGHILALLCIVAAQGALYCAVTKFQSTVTAGRKYLQAPADEAVQTIKYAITWCKENPQEVCIGMGGTALR